MSDLQAINTLKGLVIDAVHKANAGHPGGAMSSMDFAYLLFTEFLAFDPDDVRWQGRDRFILSAGHESALLYTLLHCQGFLAMDELKRFRQMHAKTAGHPENFLLPGVECTTGPLGQGAAMSVGFAIAARHFAARLAKDLFSYKTWVLCGDGDMQEDVTLGAASLAGHLRLGNLVWYYDKNRVQISGSISRTTSDNHRQIFEGFGWRVLEVNGHDHAQLRAALREGKGVNDRPLLIIGETTIAKGAFSMEGSAKTHGSPLPAEERLKTKDKLGLPRDQDFFLPADVLTHFRRHFPERAQEAKAWRENLRRQRQDNADFAELYSRCFDKLDDSHLPTVTWPRDKEVATRNAFGDVLEKWADVLPNLMGGSADLEPSNMTEAFMKKVGDFSAEKPAQRNLAFGVREFPMSAICNGLALHGGIIPFDATFLSFSDYSRPALRLGAIQKVRVIHEFTHDSFYLGEDGPTHQPVEHIMSLRLMPDFYVMRPADAFETEVMMREALRLTLPSAVCLSRQKLPILPVDAETVKKARYGAYVVSAATQPELIILATGAEVSLALKAAKALNHLRIKVVSMPCWELFEAQTSAYRDSVIDPQCWRRVSIEAGSTLGWQKYTGHQGLNIGLDRYGDSGPAEDLEKEYGFTPEQVAAKIKAWWGTLS